MASTREFLRSIFAALDARGIRWVVIHGHGKLPEVIETDVDVAISSDRLGDMPRLLHDVAEAAGWMVVHAVQHEAGGVSTMLMDGADPFHLLQFDWCGDFTRNGVSIVENATLLDGATRERGLSIPRPAVEFAAVLGKALQKRRPPEVYRPRLEALFPQDPAGCEGWLRTFLGKRYSCWPEASKQLGSESVREEFVRRRSLRAREKTRECARLMRRTLFPTGLSLAVFGPDGIGKSTMLAALESWLLRLFRSTGRYHFRPMVLSGRTTGGAVTNPHAEPARGRVAALAKILVYFADEWAGWLLRVRPTTVRNGCIIFDRHFEDVLVDRVRYRLPDLDWAIRCLLPVLPPLDLRLVLTAPARQIHARKPELPVEEIDRQLERLAALAGSPGTWVKVDASADPASVAKEAARRIGLFLADRERKALQ